MADIKNIKIGSLTPDKRMTLHDGTVTEIKRTYKVVDGQPVIVWDIGTTPIIKNIIITKWNIAAGSFTFPALTSDSIPYTLSWGDGSHSSGFSNTILEHTYAEPGEYTVTLDSEIIFENGYGKGIFYIGTALSNQPCLKYVDMESSWISLSNEMFSGCTALETVRLSKQGQITSTPESLFSGCTNLKYLFNYENIKIIASNTFYCCTALSDIEFPALQSVGSYAFYNCGSLESFILPETVSSIGDNVFTQSGLKNIKIPENIKTVSSICYKCRKLETVKGLGLQSILTGSFWASTSLKEIELSNNLKLIKKGAFSFASGAKIYFHGTKTEWNSVTKESGWYDTGSYTVIYIS